MCGVFSYVSSAGKGPDIDLIVEIAKITASRGRDAHGWAWIDKNDNLKSHKAPGPIDDPDTLERMVADLNGAPAFIAHTRFATHGTHLNNANNHPHSLADGFFVHNGVIHNYLDLQSQYRLKPTSDCDSEVMGLMFRSKVFRMGKRCERWRRVLARTENYGRLVTLNLWRDQIFAARVGSGNPLHTGRDERGKYIASLQAGLPGEIMYVKPNFMITFQRKGEGYIETKAVKLAEMFQMKYPPANTPERWLPRGERSNKELWDMMDDESYEA